MMEEPKEALFVRSFSLLERNQPGWAVGWVLVVGSYMSVLIFDRKRYAGLSV